MPLTSTYLKQMKLRVMNSQEQVSALPGPACAQGLNRAMGWGTVMLGGCFWEWLVCLSSDQVLMHGSWEASHPGSPGSGEAGMCQWRGAEMGLIKALLVTVCLFFRHTVLLRNCLKINMASSNLFISHRYLGALADGI